MTKIYRNACTVVITTILLGSSLVHAETSSEEKKKSPFEGLPQSGTLASSTSGRTTSVGGFESQEAKQDSPQPIGGSISRGTGGQWKAKIFNNSESSVQVTANIVEYTLQRSVIKRTPLAATIRPKGSYERVFTVAPSTTDASIELSKWKELKK